MICIGYIYYRQHNKQLVVMICSGMKNTSVMEILQQIQKLLEEHTDRTTEVREHCIMGSLMNCTSPQILLRLQHYE
jgi:hypothetical protein